MVRLEVVMNIFDLLHPQLRTCIQELGYREPTEVQVKAIPVILSGKHTLITAPTGTGKTEAAVFPLLHRLLELRDRGELRRGTYLLYITPLRALNRDILRRLQVLVQRLGFTVAVRHSDTPESERRRQVREPPTVLITTPETLQFLLVGRRLRETLRTVQWVVVDELHELITDKRGTQLSIALERLVHLCGHEFQRIGLSATIGDLDLARKFLGGVGREVEVVEVRMERRMRISVEWPQVRGDEPQVQGLTPEAVRRLLRIRELVESATSVLIFTNTRDTAESLATRLKTLGLPVEVHHGSLSREHREDVEKRFKEGSLKCIVCTSSLELGIDVGTVDLVIQYMSPRQVTRLVQRVGRSGHRVGDEARGVVITSTLDDVLESLVITHLAYLGKLEKLRIHEKALDVLAHQVLGIVLSEKRARVQDILKIVRRAYPYRDLSEEELRRVLDFLQELRYVRVEGDVVVPRVGSWRYYCEAASTIPDVRKYVVLDIVSGRKVGELDEDFVAVYCDQDFKFILGGRAWRVLSVDHEKLTVQVEPSEDLLGAVPAWIGEEIPVPFEVAQEVGAVKRVLALLYRRYGREACVEYLVKRFRCSEEVAERVCTEFEKFLRTGYPVPTDRDLVIESDGRVHVLHTHFGTLVNQTLAHLLPILIQEKYRVHATARSDPYRILIITSTPLPPRCLEELLREKIPLREVLSEQVKNTKIFRWRLFQVAKRLGIISREASLKELRKVCEALRGTLAEEEALRELFTDYFDVEKTEEVLERIREGRISTYVVQVHEFSPLAQPILYEYLRFDYVPTTATRSLLVEMVKRRLLERTVRLLCLHCLNWYFEAKLKYVPRPLICPRCEARTIAVLSSTDDVDQVRKLMEKYRERRKLTKEEESTLRRLIDTASLVAEFGWYAVAALCGRGIGPRTAVKVLNRLREGGEEEFYLAVLEAEREYARTRPFWED